MKLFRTLVMVLAMMPTLAFSGHPAEDLVKKLTDELLTNLQKPEAKDEGFIDAVVDKEVLPHIDFVLMTKFAIGSKQWVAATKEQRQSLVGEFRGLLLNVYTEALREYSGQTLEFLPFTPGKKEEQAEVATLFKDPGSGVRFPVSYMLRKNKKDQWKIYDIAVDSASLLKGYKAEFSSQIKKGGIDGLIKILQKKNASA